MQTSPPFSDLGREHRQEVTNNWPTKPPQHHRSHALISILLQVPCLELCIYTVSVPEQEIQLLASKGLILLLVDYEIFLYLVAPLLYVSQNSTFSTERTALQEVLLSLLSSISFHYHTHSQSFSVAFEKLHIHPWSPLAREMFLFNGKHWEQHEKHD